MTTENNVVDLAEHAAARSQAASQELTDQEIIDRSLAELRATGQLVTIVQELDNAVIVNVTDPDGGQFDGTCFDMWIVPAEIRRRQA